MNKITYTLGGFFTLLVLANLLGSCEIANPAEGIPAIVTVDSATLVVNTNQGTDRQIIRDVYFSAGTEFVGAFPLPAEIPVLASGEQDIAIDFGIIENGIAGLRTAYPFWERKTMRINMVSGEFNELGTLTTEYKSSSEIELLNQDFDSGSSITFESIDSAPFNLVPASEAFEGNSRRIKLDSLENIAVLGSRAPYLKVSDTPSQIFMELHYKSDVNMEIFLKGYNVNAEPVSGAEPIVLGLLARDTWRKVYVNLGPTVALFKGDNQVDRFQIIFRGEVSSSTPETFYMNFDNLKVLRLRQ